MHGMMSHQRQLEEAARHARRARLLAHGGAVEYHDAGFYAIVERILRRVVEQHNDDALLLRALLDDEDEWRLEPALTLSSHRRVVGPLIVFVKRRLLLPMMRWLYEYASDNFRRQQRLNLLLFACIEQLAIEHARLTWSAAR
jgi:hypothetical protein